MHAHTSNILLDPYLMYLPLKSYLSEKFQVVRRKNGRAHGSPQTATNFPI
jgi:hypothetical protein